MSEDESEEDQLPPKLLRRNFEDIQRFYEGDESVDPTVVGRGGLNVSREALLDDPDTALATLGDTTESLPVLESFRGFVETERRKARAIVLTLVGGFVLLLLVVLGGTIVIVSHLRQEISENRRSLEVVAGSVGRRAGDTTVALNSLVNLSRNLQERMTTDRDAIGEMGRDVKAALSAELGEVGREFSHVSSVVARLEGRNMALETQMEGLRAEIAAGLFGTVPAPGPRLAARSESPPERSDDGGISLLITPRGTERAIKWRLPAP